MLPDRVSSPGPLTYQSGALPIALRGPAVVLSAIGLKQLKTMNATPWRALIPAGIQRHNDAISMAVRRQNFSSTSV